MPSLSFKYFVEILDNYWMISVRFAAVTNPAIAACIRFDFILFTVSEKHSFLDTFAAISLNYKTHL